MLLLLSKNFKLIIFYVNPFLWQLDSTVILQVPFEIFQQVLKSYAPPPTGQISLAPP